MFISILTIALINCICIYIYIYTVYTIVYSSSKYPWDWSNIISQIILAFLPLCPYLPWISRKHQSINSNHSITDIKQIQYIILNRSDMVRRIINNNSQTRYELITNWLRRTEVVRWPYISMSPSTNARDVVRPFTRWVRGKHGFYACAFCDITLSHKLACSTSSYNHGVKWECKCRSWFWSKNWW